MRENSNTLSGKIALVTGAAHRIGAVTANALHSAGMDVAIHFRSSASEARLLRDRLEQSRSGSTLLLQADLSDIGRFPELLEEISNWRGRLDVLVNNASSFYPTPVDETSEAEWDDLMTSNLKAPFFMAKTAAPLLRASNGCIVNLVDIHAERPLKGYPVYSMAKAANAMMVKAMARELGPEVRVNGVAPGVILWPEEGIAEQTKNEILLRTALRRAGDPSDVARAIRFLIQEAGYITGQIITVDGGRSLQQ